MIHCVIGTRAQLIKMAPILVSLEQNSWSYSLLYTGQHADSFFDILDEFNINTPITYILGANETNTIFKMLIWLTKLITIVVRNQVPILSGRKGCNDIVLVHGDTFSTVIGALLAKRNSIKVGHVESGLRSFNLFHPFPEEINRLIVFKFTDFAYCPNDTSLKNLEKYPDIKCINTGGNTIIDSLRIALSSQQVTANSLPTGHYGVISIHRFENIYNQTTLASIIDQLIEISKNYKLIFVLHPITNKRLNKTGLMRTLDNAINIETRGRMGYSNFIHLLKNSLFVITDGGSNQEELDQLNIPTFLMRKATERNEGLKKNIVLGEYSKSKLDQFIANLQPSPRRLPINCDSTSPTSVIIGHIEPFK